MSISFPSTINKKIEEITCKIGCCNILYLSKVRIFIFLRLKIVSNSVCRHRQTYEVFKTNWVLIVFDSTPYFKNI